MSKLAKACTGRFVEPQAGNNEMYPLISFPREDNGSMNFVIKNRKTGAYVYVSKYAMYEPLLAKTVWPGDRDYTFVNNMIANRGRHEAPFDRLKECYDMGIIDPPIQVQDFARKIVFLSKCIGAHVIRRSGGTLVRNLFGERAERDIPRTILSPRALAVSLSGLFGVREWSEREILYLTNRAWNVAVTQICRRI